MLVDKSEKEREESNIVFSNPDYIPKLIKFQEQYELAYYYGFCKAKSINQKQKEGVKNISKDYIEGYFNILHNVNTKKVAFLFLKGQKSSYNISRVYSYENKSVNVQMILKVLVDEKKLVINYEKEGNELHLKFDSVDFVRAWMQLIYHYRTDLRLPIKRKQAQRFQADMIVKSDKLSSTKESPINEAQFSSMTTNSNPINSMHQYQSKQMSIQFYQLKIQQLQKQLSAKKEVEQAQVNKGQSSKERLIRDSDNEKELTDIIANLQGKLLTKEKQLQELIMEKNCEEEKSYANALNELQIQQLKEEIKKKQLLISTLQQENMALLTTIREQALQIKLFKQTEQKSSKLLDALKDSLSKSQREVDKRSRELQLLKKSSENLVLTKQMLKKQIFELEVQLANKNPPEPQFVILPLNRSKTQQNQSLQWNNKEKLLKEEFNIILTEKERKYEQIQKQLNQLKLLSNKQQKKIEQLMYYHLFNGDILENNIYLKERLKGVIQNYANQQIQKTRLLYKFDEYNKANFHHYIDGKRNLVLIVYLENGTYLAGFSQSPILAEHDSTDRGLIISLTNDKSFRCQEGKKSVSYDDYYIIFGNSQIRIKSQQTKIYSNFGITNGFYMSNGCKIDTLLGQNSREVNLESYQVYQVHFQ